MIVSRALVNGYFKRFWTNREYFTADNGRPVIKTSFTYTKRRAISCVFRLFRRPFAPNRPVKTLTNTPCSSRYVGSTVPGGMCAQNNRSSRPTDTRPHTIRSRYRAAATSNRDERSPTRVIQLKGTANSRTRMQTKRHTYFVALQSVAPHKRVQRFVRDIAVADAGVQFCEHAGPERRRSVITTTMTTTTAHRGRDGERKRTRTPRKGYKQRDDARTTHTHEDDKW